MGVWAVGNYEPVLGSGAVYLLECIHDARDQLGELIQRWDDRLTLERLSMAEQYSENRLSVTLNLNISGRKACYVQYSAIANSKSAVSERNVPDFCVDVADASNRCDGYQEPVLIDNIKTVESAEGIIPSFVRLYADRKSVV